MPPDDDTLTSRHKVIRNKKRFNANKKSNGRTVHPKFRYKNERTGSEKKSSLLKPKPEEVKRGKPIHEENGK